MCVTTCYPCAIKERIAIIWSSLYIADVIRFRFNKALYHVGEGLDSYVLIGVEAAGWHPGEVFSISVIPKDGTAKCGCILFICTTLHQV